MNKIYKRVGIAMLFLIALAFCVASTLMIRNSNANEPIIVSAESSADVFTFTRRN